MLVKVQKRDRAFRGLTGLVLQPMRQAYQVPHLLE